MPNLNSLACQIIKNGLTLSSQTTWRNLNFEDFGPQPICALTGQAKEVSEQPKESIEQLLQDAAHEHEQLAKI